MYAVILTGGKQHKVQVGEKIKIEMLPQDEGKQVIFDKVLMIVEGENANIGNPYIQGAQVTGVILKHGRHDKIRIFKFKRRKHHRKHAGHRQYYTEVEIQKIEMEKAGLTKKAVES